MGIFFSTDKCIDTTDFAEFADEFYMVERYFGFEDNWQVSYPKPDEIEKDWGFYKKSAYFDIDSAKWSIYSHNGKNDPDFLQSFRELSKIYPSRLKGQEDARKDWQAKVYIKLEAAMKMNIAPKVEAMINDAKNHIEV